MSNSIDITIRDMIQGSLHDKVDKIIEEESEAAARRTAERVREFGVGIALKVGNHVSVDESAGEITIRVKPSQDKIGGYDPEAFHPRPY